MLADVVAGADSGRAGATRRACDGPERLRCARGAATFHASRMIARDARRQIPSFLRRSSFTVCGFAFPPDAFIT
jgi:hypothetical protein